MLFYEFFIDGGDFYQVGSIFVNVMFGNYDLIVCDENGCIYEANVVIIQFDFIVVIIEFVEAMI